VFQSWLLIVQMEKKLTLIKQEVALTTGSWLSSASIVSAASKSMKCFDFNAQSWRLLTRHLYFIQCYFFNICNQTKSRLHDWALKSKHFIDLDAAETILAENIYKNMSKLEDIAETQLYCK
jgi:hypothetical protein